jgi:hypothetical protein
MSNLHEVLDQVKELERHSPGRQDVNRMLTLKRIEVIQNTVRETKRALERVQECLVEIPDWDTGPNIIKKAVISCLSAMIPLLEEILEKDFNTKREAFGPDFP